MLLKLRNQRFAAGAVVTMALGVSAPAYAGMPVIDAANLVEAVKQVRFWGQQLQDMMLQYNQLMYTYQSITGPRGMQNLLPVSVANRNYLPTSSADLLNVMNGRSATYPNLSGQVQSIIQSNALLNGAAVARLSPQAQRFLQTSRQSAAALTMLSQATTSNAGNNFSSLQRLISALGGTKDTKASMDLAGRIQSEQVMTQNNQIKTDALYHTVQAQQLQSAEFAREAVVTQLATQSSITRINW